jgi:hypothetical protein
MLIRWTDGVEAYGDWANSLNVLYLVVILAFRVTGIANTNQLTVWLVQLSGSLLINPGIHI